MDLVAFVLSIVAFTLGLFAIIGVFYVFLKLWQFARWFKELNNWLKEHVPDVDVTPPPKEPEIP